MNWIGQGVAVTITVDVGVEMLLVALLVGVLVPVGIVVLEGMDTVLVGEPVITVPVGVAVEGVPGSQWGRIKTNLMPSARIGLLQEN